MIKDMTPEQIEELQDDARRAIEHVGMLGPQGEKMDCLICGLPLAVKRNGNSWNVDCHCGWSAAGSSPRPAN